MLVFLSLSYSCSSVATETLRVGGTGSSAPLATHLFAAFKKHEPFAAFVQHVPPLGSTGALKVLSAGGIDLALIGRPLSASEATTVGRSFLLAETPLVLASNGGRRAVGFSTDELAHVYEGSLQRWDDGKPIRLVLRSSRDSDTLTLKSMSPAMRTAVDFSAQRPGMAMGIDDLATVDLLKRVPGSLGPTSLGLLRTLNVNLELLPIDGTTPTVENLKSGRYAWRKSIVVVLPVQPSALAVRFAAFLSEPETQELLLKYGYIPGTP